MSSAKRKYCSELQNKITKYNNWNNTPLSYVNIREANNQVMLEERVITEENNATVDTFMGSTQRNKIEDMTNKVANLTITIRKNNVMINKIVNLTKNDAKKV